MTQNTQYFIYITSTLFFTILFSITLFVSITKKNIITLIKQVFIYWFLMFILYGICEFIGINFLGIMLSPLCYVFISHLINRIKKRDAENIIHNQFIRDFQRNLQKEQREQLQWERFMKIEKIKKILVSL